MVRLIPIPIALAVFSFGCGSTTTELRRFTGSINDSVQGGALQRVAGSNTLLEVFQFTSPSLLAPTGWWGHSLFVEAPADLFRPGTTIKIPDERIRTFYYQDYHHLGRVRKQVSGTIHVIKVADDYILGNVNLVVDGTDYKFKLKGKFKNADISKYSRIER